MSEPGFDRLRRRGPAARGTAPVVPLRADPQGRQSLYSVSEQTPPPGTMTVECSDCGLTSVVTPRRLLMLALPSLHLPLVRRSYPSWMRCPACGRRTWVRVGLTF